jgi:hypothetical protein
VGCGHYLQNERFLFSVSSCCDTAQYALGPLAQPAADFGAKFAGGPRLAGLRQTPVKQRIGFVGRLTYNLGMVFEGQNLPPAGGFSECASNHGPVFAGVVSRTVPILGLDDALALAISVIAGGPPITDPPLRRVLYPAEQATDLRPIVEELIRW